VRLTRFGLVFEWRADRRADALGNFVEDEMRLKNETGSKTKTCREMGTAVGWVEVNECVTGSHSDDRRTLRSGLAQQFFGEPI
jgi:hypothetical protein